MKKVENVIDNRLTQYFHHLDATTPVWLTLVDSDTICVYAVVDGQVVGYVLDRHHLKTLLEEAERCE